MPTETGAQEVPALDLEYGTVVPMRYMNPTGRISVVSVAGWSALRGLEEQRLGGEAIVREIARGDRKVARAASGSPSHQKYPSANLGLAGNTVAGDTLRHVLTQECGDDEEPTFTFETPGRHLSLVDRAPGAPA